MTARILTASQRGFSLIELIIAIMIIGASVVGVLSMMNFLAARSADPMIQEQAMLIGEAYLDEILLKPFLDPSAGTANVCPAPETEGRSYYDNVCDYNGLTDAGAPDGDGPRDQFGNPIADLGAYTVTVTVEPKATNDAVTLGPAGSQISNTGVLRVLRVDVRVQGPGTMALMLTGYRTNYNCNATGDAACKPL